MLLPAMLNRRTCNAMQVSEFDVQGKCVDISQRPQSLYTSKSSAGPTSDFVAGMLEAACMVYCMRIAVVRMLEGGPACCSAVPAYASPKDGPTLVLLTSPVRLTAACRLY